MKVELELSDAEYKLLDAMATMDEKTIQEYMHDAVVSWIAAHLSDVGSMLQNERMGGSRNGEG